MTSSAINNVSDDNILSVLGDSPLWHPQSNTYVNAQEALQDCWILLYFGSSWCRPCVKFTPKLIRTYQNLNANVYHRHHKQQQQKQRRKIEVIFVSMDHQKSFFHQYASKMPWLVIPYDDEYNNSSSLHLREQISHQYLGTTRAIPHLCMFNPEGVLQQNHINHDYDFVYHITKDVEGKYFPWSSNCFNSIASSSCYGNIQDYPVVMNEIPCIIVYCEQADDEVQENVQKACMQVAHQLNNNKSKKTVQILWVLKPNPVSDCIRQATNISCDFNYNHPFDDEIQIVLLDLPDNASYYVNSSSISHQNTFNNDDCQDEKFLIKEIVRFYRNPGIRRQLQ